MKSIQELAREYANGFTTEVERNIAFKAFQDAYRKGYEDKHKRDDYDVSFAVSSFQPLMIEWLSYKKERKESYKSQRSVIACYNKLYELSDGDAQIAEAIILQSIASNYSGLFPLKKSYGNGNNNQRQVGNSQSIFDAANSYLQGCQ